MKKYMYGKKDVLLPISKGKYGVRFSDLRHYALLENQRMRDDESQKQFVLHKDYFGFEISGIKISPESFADHPSLTAYVSPCFCLCLSSKKNDEEMYEWCGADICLEIDVIALRRLLNDLPIKFRGMTIVEGDVKYYPPIFTSGGPDLRSALFYKREFFQVEAEYRIALIIPPWRKYFQTEQGIRVPIFGKDPSHISINTNDPSLTSGYVTGVFFR